MKLIRFCLVENSIKSERYSLSKMRQLLKEKFILLFFEYILQATPKKGQISKETIFRKLNMLEKT